MTENLFEVLDRFFAAHQFEKDKLTWFQKKNDSFIVFQFQKFRYDPKKSGFLNFGIVFNIAKKKIKKPKGEDTWDLRGRVPCFGPTPLPNELFKIEIIENDEKLRVSTALDSIKKEIIPYLENYSNLSNLIDDLKNRRFDFAKALTRITP